MLKLVVVALLSLGLVLGEERVLRQVRGGVDAVRLVNGSNNQTGRVEVMSGGVWGTVCDDWFGRNGARVVCRSLGFQDDVGHVLSLIFFGLADLTMPILLDDVRCHGNESSLNECDRSPIEDLNCNHYEDVAVSCLQDNIESVRLVGGPTARAGRLEVMSFGVWGTVCDQDFDNNASSVICRSLGFSNGVGKYVLSEALFGHAARGSPVMLTGVTCLGDESSLNECEHTPLGSSFCLHWRDVGIICEDQEIEGVRLVGGSSPQVGRLEVLSQGVWGMVCDDQFDTNAATVVCRSLGFSGNLTSFIPRSNLDPLDPAMTILLDDVRCHGNESSIIECEHAVLGDHDCRRNENVGLICGVSIAQVRLVNGATPQEGRVEVLVNGTWGSVCDDLFARSAAQVVCRMLGYQTTGPQVFRSAHFGEGSGPIHLDTVQCEGDEGHLDQCRLNWEHHCHHNEDVGVRCG